MQRVSESKIKEILEKFQVKYDKSYAIEGFETGLLHETFRIGPYVLQRVNTFAFKNPKDVMHNIKLVSNHLKAKGIEGLSFLETEDGELFFEDESGFWRISKYIDSVTHLVAADESMAGECGRAFGSFDAAISDLNVSDLKVTIPDFHNTRKRYEDFEKAVLKSEIDDASIEVGKFLAIKEEACALCDANLPLRVCHNDTKPSNVLFDRTGRAIAVIDWDTIMPGNLCIDYGDGARLMDTKEKLKAFTLGFFESSFDIMNDEEKAMMPKAPFCIAAELGLRYLTDHLNGDKYFKINYKGENLDKARKMLECLDHLY